jgi:hypothetical protein
MYDDGEMDDKRLVTNNGYAIKYTIPRGEWEIKSVRFFAVRSGTSDVHGKMITMYVCEGENAGHVMAEKRVGMGIIDTVSAKWRNIDLDVPLYHTGDFWIIIDPDSSMKDGIFMGADSSPEITHSKMGRPGTLTDLEGTYEWMVRVQLQEAEPPEEVDNDSA